MFIAAELLQLWEILSWVPPALSAVVSQGTQAEQANLAAFCI